MKAHRWPIMALVIMPCLLLAGCDQDVETTYGRVQGQSINGIGAFVELLRADGHQVRNAIRATDELSRWTDVVVRFSPRPGLPSLDEGEWLTKWLKAKSGRKLIYIPRDFDSELEFWEAMLAIQPQGSDPAVVERIRKRRDAAKLWVGELPPKFKVVAKSADWFAQEPKPTIASTCKTLQGPWAVDVDAAGAAVVKHEVFKPEGEERVLLRGDGSPLAMAWSLDNESQVLALANASFLLNASLLNRARRPLTMKVVEWIGKAPLHIAIIEGHRVFATDGDMEEPSTSPFRFFQVEPFNWIGSHLLAFLLLLALSYAVRLGRPLPEPPSGVERPSAHPEALGALMAKTGRSDAARFLLESYRRWRSPSYVAGRAASAPPTSR